MFGQSGSRSNRHGLGGQAKAESAEAGRARPFGGLALRGKGQCCVNPCGQNADACKCPADAEYPNRCTGAVSCARQLKLISEGASVAATRTPSEIAKRGGTMSEYNLPRLRLYLLEHAFDAQGSVVVHLVCLQGMLNVSNWFCSSLHKDAIARARAKTESIPKSKVVSLKLTDEEVLRPEGSVGSLSVYLSTLKDEDMVTVVTQVGRHGLTGKPSNGASTRERELFVDFVKEHRSPTGRTQDATGRYHGAEFYLISRLTEIKTQSGRETKDEDAVLEIAFKKALQGRSLVALEKPYKPPSGTTIRTWLLEDFGIRSEHGHTTLFPHKTDACAICSSLEVDIKSVEMWLKRHGQQTSDAGSIERQVRVPL